MKILQRYLLKEFLKYFFIITFSFYLVFVIGNFVEKFSRLQDTSFVKIALYYAYSFPEIFNQLAPFIIFFSVLLSIGNLGRQNELIIIEISGIKPVRTLYPAFVFILLISLLSYFNANFFSPHYKAKAERIYRIDLRGHSNWFSELGKTNLGIISEKNERMYLFSDYYNAKRKVMLRPVIIILDEKNILKKRIDAFEANYQGEGNWDFKEVEIRTFRQNAGLAQYNFYPRRFFPLSIDPSLFNTLRMKPDTMTSSELGDTIENIRALGKTPTRFSVEKENRRAYPFFLLLISMLGFSIALKTKKENMGRMLGLSLIIIALYVTIYRFSYTLGNSGILPPVLAAWAGNILFTALFITLKI